MKPVFGLAILFFLTLNCKSQSHEIIKTDTINKIDAKNQKQGNWIIRGKHKPGSCYNPEQLIETGNYINNRKVGIWTEYYCNGNARNKLTYVTGILEGHAIFYDQNEKILKEGSFKENKWVKASP